MDWDATKPIGRWDKFGIGVFLLIFIAIGAMVEYRSAFLTRRMGDLDVFLRAAWAVRNDADLYRVTSDNDWHYIYPPLYAILMTPLADPPRDESAAGYVPYAASVAIFFLINLLGLFLSAHNLASALEEKVFALQPKWCRRWWVLRTWPIMVCLLPIGHTMMRGQVNIMVLTLLCAALAGWIRGQSWRAGLWLAVAICIKVIPVYLLVYPLWKRDVRAISSCAAGCLVGLVLIPVLTFGPERTVTHYQSYVTVFFGPFFNFNDDKLVKDEILGVNATDSVGVKNALHNWTYPDASRRPEDMSVLAKATYLLLGFAMTFMTLWPGTWPRRESPLVIASQFGALILLMAIFSPVCHSHYLMFCMPIVMVVLAEVWQTQPTVRLPRYVVACFTLFIATMAIAYLPGLEILKDRCAALFATIPLWGIPVVWMWRHKDTSFAMAPPMPADEQRKAA